MYKVIGGDDQEYGPVTGDELRQWIHEGRVSGQSLLKPEGTTEWRACSTFPEFDSALAAQKSALPDDASPQPDRGPAVRRVSDAAPSVDIAACLARSGQLLGANFGLVVGASCLTWLLGLMCQLVPLIGGMLYMFLQGALYGGLYLVFLKRIRGQPASVTDVFVAFSAGFGQLALAGFLSSLLSSLGFLFCLIPGIYLLVAWTFTLPLVADRGMEAWSAMEFSRKVTTRCWFQVAGLLLLAFLPTAVMYVYTKIKIFAVAYPGFQQLLSAGSLDPQRLMDLISEIAKISVPLVVLNKLVMLFNLPFAAGAIMFAYEDLFGSRKDKSR